MKTTLYFIWTGLILLFCAPIASAQEKTRKAIFIIVDGVPADVIEKLSPPTLTDIAKAGGYSRAYVGGGRGTHTETPTISAVGYNSVLTGTWVHKHNVFDNDIEEPNYSYPTIFRLLKEAYPEKTTAIFSTWLDNRTKLVGDNMPATGNITIDYHYDGMELDTVRFPHNSKPHYLNVIDDSVSRHAADQIATMAPDLTWVYLEHTDDLGHQYGDSPQFTEIILETDKRIGRIWKAIQQREKDFNEEWLLVITTDHGRDEKTGKNHGGQSDRQRSGWIYTNAKNLNEQFKAPHLSIVDIMPSIARFMNIDIPKHTAYEVDGIPFIGDLSFIRPSITASGNKLQLTWRPIKAGSGDQVSIYLSETNNFKTGGEDEYRLIRTVPLKSGKASLTLPGQDAKFSKVVLVAPHNMANGWINVSGK